MKIIAFCSTYKQKRVVWIFMFLAGLGKVLENDRRSHFVNIEFRPGRRAKIEVSGYPHSPPKSVFWRKKIVSFSAARFWNLLKYRWFLWYIHLRVS